MCVCVGGQPPNLMIPAWPVLLTDPNFTLDEAKRSVTPQWVTPQFPNLMLRWSPKTLSLERPQVPKTLLRWISVARPLWMSRWREVNQHQRPQPL